MSHIRPKIAVVAPDLSQLHLIQAIMGLSDEFEVAVFSFNTPSITRFKAHRVPLFLFDTLPDMPGYMRGLEDRLASFDGIIGLETYQLSSFQAMRAATKYRVPFGVISSTTKPYAFVEYPNIRAIQSDLLNRTDFFWPTSLKAKGVLSLEHVPDTHLEVAFPASVLETRVDRDALRKKFRSYVHIPDECLVFLFHAELDENNKPEEIIQALTVLAKTRHQNLDKIRVIFAGDGHSAKDLKYRASDSGLGPICMFLSQDPSSFLSDMYCASDVMIVPFAKAESGIARAQTNVIDAMRFGVIPMVASSGQEAEWVGSAAITWDFASYTGLAAEMAKISLASLDVRKSLSQKAIDRWQSSLSAQSLRDLWRRELSRLVTIGHQKSHSSVGVATKLQQMAEQLEAGKAQQVLIEIENEILRDQSGDRVRAELLCLRGEAHAQIGNLEDALAAFQEALQTGYDLQRAYRGLGYLSLKSHSHEEALTFFKRALAAEPEDSQSMLGIGMIYRRLKLFEDSLYWAEKCLSTSPDTLSAILLAAQTSLETNATDVAITTLERLLEVTNENRNIVVALAQLYMNAGRVAEATALFKKSDLPQPVIEPGKNVA